MPRSGLPRSFGILLGILVAATVAGVGTAVVLRALLLVPVVIGAVIVVGVVYLFRTAPAESPFLPEAPVPADEEPFEDPVEEADRLESSGAPPEPSLPGTDTTPAPGIPPSDGNDPK